jgi:hypothetical protein
MFFSSTNLVVPAEAGTHFSTNSQADEWIPAFAGMTSMPVEEI